MRNPWRDREQPEPDETPIDPRQLEEPEPDAAGDLARWRTAYEATNGWPPTHVTDDGVHFRRLDTGKIEFLCEHGIVGHDAAACQGSGEFETVRGAL